MEDVAIYFLLNWPIGVGDNIMFLYSENKTFTAFECISQLNLFLLNVCANINIIAVYNL